MGQKRWIAALTTVASLGMIPTAAQAQAAGVSFVTPEGVMIVQPLEASHRTVINQSEAVINNLVWSPAGDEMAIVENFEQVYRLRPGDSDPRPVFSSTCPRPINLDVQWQGDRDALVIKQRCESANAAGESRWQVFLAQAEGTVTPLESLPSPLTSDVFLAPDGQQIAYVANQHIYLANLDGTPPRQLTEQPAIYSAAGSPLAWSPDGSQIAYYEGSYPFQRIGVIDVATGVGRLLTPEPSFQIYRSRLVWSPNGRYLAFYQPVNPPHSNQEVVAMVEVATGERQVLTRPGFYSALSWSPDSQHLALAMGEQWEGKAMFVLTLANGRFTLLTPQSFQSVLDSGWSPTGDWLAFTAVASGDDLGTPILHVVQPNGQGLRTLSQPDEYAFPFAWIP